MKRFNTSMGAFVSIIFGLYACGQDPTPSFKSVTYDQRINLTVDDDNQQPLGENPPLDESREIPTNDEIQSVIDAMYASETFTKDGDVVDSSESGKDDNETHSNMGEEHDDSVSYESEEAGDEHLSGDAQVASEREEIDSDESEDTTNEGGDGNDSSTELDNEGEASKLSKKELSLCGKAHGVSSDYIHVTGSENHESISSQTIVALKISGNKNAAEINLAGDGSSQIAGICLFLTGNQSLAQVNLSGITLGRIFILQRGNLSVVNVDVDDRSAINEMFADLGGNSSVLNISGNGSYACETVNTRGNGSSLVCQD